MRIELKDFQESAVRGMLTDLHAARREAFERSKPQAIVLSSPTGSGKTVTMTALIERVFDGYENAAALPDATFLWLSDSPELNQQSRDKLAQASDVLFSERLVMVDSLFDREVFPAGRIYFLNTQKLGKEKLLTSQADSRRHVIWETVENTIRSRPDRFFLIIDEAHRGTSMDEKSRRTIMQKFILGDSNLGLDPFPVVIGMSATPQRFEEMTRGAARVLRPTEIHPQDVRDSGLLKDRIVLYHPVEARPSDMTMLEAAVRRWKDFSKGWDDYCRRENEATLVRPILVVQVQDGTQSALTRTDLDEVISVIERAAGPLSDENFAHAFDSDDCVTAAGRRIRKVESSRIQDEPFVGIVFFKMALSTGWDCPRAEVMMSFRRAVDHTHIAQLVGRMVRSPLARRIPGDDMLNSVELYLPNFDRQALKKILEYLQNPKNDGLPPVAVELGDNLGTYHPAPGSGAAIDKWRALPTYALGGGLKISEIKRLMKLARLLTVTNGIDSRAWDDARKAIVDSLSDSRERLIKKLGRETLISDAGEVRIKGIVVECGILRGSGEVTETLPATPENIDDLFRVCEKMLAPGEGLHMEYWKTFSDEDNPSRAKLELWALLQEESTWMFLNDDASAKTKELYERNRDRIEMLGSGKQVLFNAVMGGLSNDQRLSRVIPDLIQLPKTGESLPGHLYVDTAGMFFSDLNEWERLVVDEERSRGDFLFWLRNLDRKEWSLAVPYQENSTRRLMYPDFLIFRRQRRSIIVDILEPHDLSRDDAWKKAKGLAEYTGKHAGDFGRVELIAFEKKRRFSVDLCDRRSREKVFGIGSNEQLRGLLRPSI